MQFSPQPPQLNVRAKATTNNKTKRVVHIQRGIGTAQGDIFLCLIEEYNVIKSAFKKSLITTSNSELYSMNTERIHFSPEAQIFYQGNLSFSVLGQQYVHYFHIFYLFFLQIKYYILLQVGSSQRRCSAVCL